ncbi:AzlD domain-containing protein [Nakamurella sp.]|uniref:AzlD domain-containing protein n=1 Tax=Nakamurella sp. TaxID=1869182 RepID=UPI003B3B4547
MMLWIGVLVGCLGCYLLKLAGVSVPESVLQRPRVHRISALLPIVLLSALVAVQTFSTGSALVLDARAAGLAVAGFAVWRRAPFLVVVGLAALTTALVRLAVPGS